MDGAILVVSGTTKTLLGARNALKELFATGFRSSSSGSRASGAAKKPGYDGPMPQTREHILLARQVGVLGA